MLFTIGRSALAAIALAVFSDFAEAGRIGDDHHADVTRGDPDDKAETDEKNSKETAQSKAAQAIMDASTEMQQKTRSDAEGKEATTSPAPDALGSRRDTQVAVPTSDTQRTEPFEKSDAEKKASDAEKKAADAVAVARDVAAEAARMQKDAAIQLGEDLAKTKATAKNQMAAAVGKAATFVAEAARHGDPDKVLKVILEAYNEMMKDLEAQGPTYGLDPYATTHTTTPKPNKVSDPALKRSIELITTMAGVGEDGDSAKKDIMTQAAAIYKTAPAPAPCTGADVKKADGSDAAGAPSDKVAAALGAAGGGAGAASLPASGAADGSVASAAADAAAKALASATGAAASAPSGVSLPSTATQMVPASTLKNAPVVSTPDGVAVSAGSGDGASETFTTTEAAP